MPSRAEPPRGVRYESRLGNARLAYEVLGDGPPIVLLHGLGASGAWWARNLGALSAAHTVYVVDLLGFGRSGRQRFVLEEAPSRIATWMEATGIDRAAVIGHSMGGLISATLAVQSPERVASLVLVDAAALPFAWGYRRHVANALRGVAQTPLRFVPMTVLDSLRAGPRTLWSGVRQVLASDLTHVLPRIEARTLVIWGENDPLIPHETGRLIAALIPHAEFALIPRAAHNPMWDQPEAFNSLVTTFLAADEGSPTRG